MKSSRQSNSRRSPSRCWSEEVVMRQNVIRKIVVGTDFNELAAAALRLAGGIAARAGAELVVVYADVFHRGAGQTHRRNDREVQEQDARAARAPHPQTRA